MIIQIVLLLNILAFLQQQLTAQHHLSGQPDQERTGLHHNLSMSA